jgi:hypothetical protein
VRKRWALGKVRCRGFPSLYFIKEQTLEYDKSTTFIYIKMRKDRKILNTYLKLSYLQNICVNYNIDLKFLRYTLAVFGRILRKFKHIVSRSSRCGSQNLEPWSSAHFGHWTKRPLTAALQLCGGTDWGVWHANRIKSDFMKISHLQFYVQGKEALCIFI